MNDPRNPIDQVQWFDQEKPLLYDYLVRMTGDPDPASTTLLEVMQAVTTKLKGQGATVENLRVLLYQTARSFCADRWHQPPKELLEQAYRGINDTAQLRELEGLISTFGPFQREAIFLKFRYGFQATDISQITGKSLVRIQDLINHGVLNIRKQFPNFTNQSMKQLPLFKIQDVEAQSTIAISKLIKIDRTERFKTLRTFLWLFLILLALYYYVTFG